VWKFVESYPEVFEYMVQLQLASTSTRYALYYFIVLLVENAVSAVLFEYYHYSNTITTVHGTVIS
jgi:hypothetical protein